MPIHERARPVHISIKPVANGYRVSASTSSYANDEDEMIFVDWQEAVTHAKCMLDKLSPEARIPMLMPGNQGDDE